MKHLVLIRHAKSDWTSPALSDFDRPLNKKGLKDAPRIAGILKERGIFPDLIISSPANRALTTARIMAEEYGVASDTILQIPSLYLGDTSDLAAALYRTPDKTKTLFLFAHNPGISYFASQLVCREIGMPTCCAVVISLEGSWENPKIRETAVLKPKDFR